MSIRRKSAAKERIQNEVDAISALRGQSYDSPIFRGWKRDVEVAIAFTFGSETRHLNDFRRIRFTPIMNSRDGRQQLRRRQAYAKGLDEASVILASMVSEIEEYWADYEEKAEHTNSLSAIIPSDLKKVFIVHGRDHGTRDSVARFINDLGLEPVILQEQPNEGLTIIEKFEKYAEVGFAVVLFTPDDIGAYKGDEDEFRLRARQNVIFELGYLVSHLGRGRVVVLYKGSEGDIEIPSDYAGVLYTPMDDGGGWRFPLIGELKSADLEVDANRAFQT